MNIFKVSLFHYKLQSGVSGRIWCKTDIFIILDFTEFYSKRSLKFIPSWRIRQSLEVSKILIFQVGRAWSYLICMGVSNRCEFGLEAFKTDQFPTLVYRTV